MRCLFIALVLSSVLLSSCSKDNVINEENQESTSVSPRRLEQLVVSALQKDVYYFDTKGIDPLVVSYLHVVKSIAYGTRVFETEPKNQEAGSLLASDSTFRANPISLMLKNVDIESNDGKQSGFYGLPMVQRMILFELILLELGRKLTEDIKNTPDLKKEVNREKEILLGITGKWSVPSLKFGECNRSILVAFDEQKTEPVLGAVVPYSTFFKAVYVAFSKAKMVYPYWLMNA